MPPFLFRARADSLSAGSRNWALSCKMAGGMETNLSSFKSDRKFSAFSYGVSHGLLLSRSGKTNEHPTRVDVLIQDVRAMEIRSWFEGLEITEVDLEYLREFRSNPVEMIEPGNRVYALRGNGWQGFIVAGIFSVQEDELEFMAPSGLLAQRTI